MTNTKKTMTQQVRQQASAAMKSAPFDWAVASLRLLKTEQVEKLAEWVGVSLDVPRKNPGQYKMAISAKVRAAIRHDVEDAIRRAFLHNDDAQALLEAVAEKWRGHILAASE